VNAEEQGSRQTLGLPCRTGPYDCGRHLDGVKCLSFSWLLLPSTFLLDIQESVFCDKDSSSLPSLAVHRDFVIYIVTEEIYLLEK